MLVDDCSHDDEVGNLFDHPSTETPPTRQDVPRLNGIDWRLRMLGSKSRSHGVPDDERIDSTTAVAHYHVWIPLKCSR